MEYLQWVKAFHVIAMVVWMGGLLLFPRVLAFYVRCSPAEGKERDRFVEMEKTYLLRTFLRIITPSMILTFVLGIWIVDIYGGGAFMRTNPWFHAKSLGIMILFAYHVHCFFLLRSFAAGRNRYGPRFFAVYNQLPVAMLVAIVVLVVVKPF